MATYTQQYTFSNGTTADGGQVNTEIVALGQSVNNVVNAQVDSAAAIAISKTTLGTYTAPTSWTPQMYRTSSATTITSTNNVSHYTQIGKTVIAVVSLQSIDVSFGTVTDIDMSLPVPCAADAASGNPGKVIGTGYTFDGTTQAIGYAFTVAGQSTSKCTVRNGPQNNWGVNGSNRISMTLIYEAA